MTYKDDYNIVLLDRDQSPAQFNFNLDYKRALMGYLDTRPVGYLNTLCKVVK